MGDWTAWEGDRSSQPAFWQQRPRDERRRRARKMDESRRKWLGGRESPKRFFARLRFSASSCQLLQIERVRHGGASPGAFAHLPQISDFRSTMTLEMTLATSTSVAIRPDQEFTEHPSSDRASASATAPGRNDTSTRGDPPSPRAYCRLSIVIHASVIVWPRQVLSAARTHLRELVVEQRAWPAFAQALDDRRPRHAELHQD